MQKQISKKIIFYLFIFILLGTLNNKNLFEIKFNKDYDFKITSLSDFDDREIIKDLSDHKNQNLFFLNKDKILETLQKHKTIEDFNIFKNYPSELKIKIKKTQFLAITQKNGINFYIGSNGNLIKNDNYEYDLPFIFGNVEVIEFLKFIDLINNSKFNYFDIKNLYYFKSKRWDIETKDGILIKLPMNNLSRSLEILSKFINENNLENIDYIDLRQNNQIIFNG